MIRFLWTFIPESLRKVSPQKKIRRISCWSVSTCVSVISANWKKIEQWIIITKNIRFLIFRARETLISRLPLIKWRCGENPWSWRTMWSLKVMLSAAHSCFKFASREDSYSNEEDKNYHVVIWVILSDLMSSRSRRDFYGRKEIASCAGLISFCSVNQNVSLLMKSFFTIPRILQLHYGGQKARRRYPQSSSS